MWNFKPEDSVYSSVMRSTVINTSKEMTAFSDFPPPDHFANYMHNRQLHKYFKMYTKHHDLYKYIRFHNTVQNIQRSDDYEKTGQWNLDFVDQ